MLVADHPSCWLSRYLTDPGAKSIQGKVFLPQSIINPDKDGHGFRVIQAGDTRSFEFRALSRDECNLWVSTLKALSAK